MSDRTMHAFRTLALIASATLMSLAASVVDALDDRIATGEPPWAAPLARVNAAMTTRNPAQASQALQQAYLAALGSRRWDGMVAVGEAAHRAGVALDAARAYDATARRAYLVAFFRARHDRSLEGVVQVAEAFGALGDAEVVKQCIGLARSLIARSPDEAAQARLRTLEQRLAERSFASGPRRVEPF